MNTVTKASIPLFQNDFVLILFLLVFSLSLYTFKLGDCPFFNPDEGIHAQVAKNMVVDGDWITPRFNGSNFYDKPILYYWLNALSFKLFGVNEFAARFPAAILGSLGVILTYLLGKALYDKWTGFLAALILSISFQYIFLSRLVVHDISLMFGIILSLFFFYHGFLQNKNRTWVIPFFYISLAWSVLAKGPLGLVLPGMIIGPYILLRKEWRLLKEMQLGLGIIIFLPLVATWYVPVSLINKDFLSYFIFHQHLQQFLSAEESNHNASVFYYIPAFFGGLFPWSFFVPYAWFRTMSPLKKLLTRKEDLFLLLWFTVPLIFFSIARSKLTTYILPVYPAASIMAARIWKDSIINVSARTKAMLYPLLALIIILVPAFIYLLLYYPSYWYIGLLLITGTALAFYCSFQNRAIFSFALLTATSALTFLAVIIFVMPCYIHIFSTRDLAGYLKQVSSPSDQVADYNRIANSTVFYSDRQVKLIRGRDNLLEYMNQQGRWYLMIDEKQYVKNKDEITKQSKFIYREGNRLLLTNK